MNITALTNTDRAFYPTMGPFLARREVAAQVGDAIWDDDAKTWLVARVGRRVVGFVAVAARGKRTVVESLYLADAADEDLAARLVAAAVEAAPAGTLHATVRHGLKAAHAGAGFTVVKESRNFTTMVREG